MIFLIPPGRAGVIPCIYLTALTGENLVKTPIRSMGNHTGVVGAKALRIDARAIAMPWERR